MGSTAIRTGLFLTLFVLAFLAASLLHDLVLPRQLRTGMALSAPVVTLLAAGLQPIWRPRLASLGRRFASFAMATTGGLLVYAAALLVVSSSMDSPDMAAFFIAAGVLLSPLTAWQLSKVALRSVAVLPKAGWWPRRPVLEQLNHEALQLYTTDDLRRLYHVEGSDLARLRDGIVSRAELRAVILWRVWWDRAGYRALLVVTTVGTAAAIVAAVEGWR